MTLGGPIRHDKDFFFAYYEGQRSRQGETRTAIVPNAAERSGNFSGLTDSSGNPEPLINEFTGEPFTFNGVFGQIPPFILSPIALKAESLIPLPNIGPSLYSSTQLLTNNYDQGGFRLDHYFGNGDQLFARYATASQYEFDPLPINGSGVPGFPVTDNVTTNSFTMSHVHLFSPQLIQTARVAFFPQRLFGGRGDQSHSGERSWFHVQADTPLGARRPIPDYSRLAIGDPITGPQNTVQNDYQAYYSLAMDPRRHNLKFGGNSTISKSTYCSESLLTASSSSRHFRSAMPSLVFC